MFKSSLKIALLSSMALCAIAPAAFAQDGSDWLSKDRFMLRGRLIGVLPDGDGVVEGTSLATDVSNSLTPELDVSYFFTPHIAAELIAATAKHSIDAGTLDVGDTWILPPTVTLQYHFMPDNAFSPYVGAGLNYSFFYGEDAAGSFDNLDVNGGVGYALQAGFDYWINDNWGLNLDAKYIDLNVDVDVDSAGSTLHANGVELNPWVVGAGVSYRF